MTSVYVNDHVIRVFRVCQLWLRPLAQLLGLFPTCLTVYSAPNKALTVERSTLSHILDLFGFHSLSLCFGVLKKKQLWALTLPLFIIRNPGK